jgi:hypothetical protein
MPRPKGLPKTGGRQPGTPNKVTASMREAWREAFDRLGGVDSLVAWGQTEPTEFYRLVTKLIPQDVTSGDKPLSGIVILPPTTE